MWKLPTGGGQELQVTRNGGFAARESLDGKWLYYLKGAYLDTTSLWRCPAEGGEEIQLLDGVHNTNFDVADHGVYFISRPESDAGFAVKFFNSATGTITRLRTLGKPVSIGLSVSPDGRSILYTQLDDRSSDLMLVENFR